MPKESMPGSSNQIKQNYPGARGGSKAEIKSSEKNEERDRLVLKYLPLVRIIAIKIKENLPINVDLDDLIQTGILGLIEALARYDQTKNVKLASYAKHRIKGAILDSLRDLDWASRDLRRRKKQLDIVTENLKLELQHNPSEEEVAAAMGWSVEKLRLKMIDMRTIGLVSSSTRGYDAEGGDLPVPDFSGKPEDRPDFITQSEELRSVLSEAIASLSPRFQQVIFLYYTEEKTQKEIAEILEVAESRISQIHKSALEKLYMALREKGIYSTMDFLLRSNLRSR